MRYRPTRLGGRFGARRSAPWSGARSLVGNASAALRHGRTLRRRAERERGMGVHGRQAIRLDQLGGGRCTLPPCGGTPSLVAALGRGKRDGAPSMRHSPRLRPARGRPSLGRERAGGACLRRRQRRGRPTTNVERGHGGDHHRRRVGHVGKVRRRGALSADLPRRGERCQARCPLDEDSVPERNGRQSPHGAQAGAVWSAHAAGEPANRPRLATEYQGRHERRHCTAGSTARPAAFRWKRQSQPKEEIGTP